MTARSSSFGAFFDSTMDRFGETVEVLGDQDGDSWPELLVEASFFQLSGDGVNTRGRCYLLPGRAVFASEGEEFLRGDSDLNGIVNVTDAIVVLGALFLGKGPLQCADAADVNDDGVLNITDPIYLLAGLFLGGGPPAPPRDRPGPDPTPDSLDCIP